MAPLATFADSSRVDRLHQPRWPSGTLNGGQNRSTTLEFAEQVLPQVGLDRRAAGARSARTPRNWPRTSKSHMPDPRRDVGRGLPDATGASRAIASTGATRPGLDGAKPLGLLEHVGGSPILAVVARSKMSIDHYDGFVRGSASATATSRVRASANEGVRARELPRSRRTGRARFSSGLTRPTARLFLPALDGQGGLVVDAKLMSKQFIEDPARTDEAMPMAEPAIVLGVQRPGLMRQALVEYWGDRPRAVGARP